MSAAWIAAPGVLVAALTVLLARRVISPAGYAQAIGGLAVGLLIVFAALSWGGRDGG